MSVEANIFIYHTDGFDGGRCHMAPTVTNRHVIETHSTTALDRIVGQIEETRRGRFRDLEGVKLTILAHGVTESDGSFWIQVGTGLREPDARLLRPLGELGLRKIIFRSCGPVTPPELGTRRLHPPGHAAMQNLYSRVAAETSTEVIAAETAQTVYHTTASAETRTSPWVGVRFVYSPTGERRGIMPHHDE